MDTGYLKRVVADSGVVTLLIVAMWANFNQGNLENGMTCGVTAIIYMGAFLGK